MSPEIAPLDGKLALVTGGARGTGRAIVEEIARLGARVIVNYCHSEEDAERTRAELGGAVVATVRASVAREDSVARLFRSIEERWGTLDILVNNAASGAFGALGELSGKDWARAIDTNLLGTLRCSQHAAALMRDRGGVICNVSSTGSTYPVPGYAAVGVTKAAVESLTRYLSYEYRDDNIRVNCASAGPLESRPLRQLLPDPVAAQRVAEQTPARRLGVPAELAAVVGFLVSPAAGWMWGQTVIADGGLSLTSWPSAAVAEYAVRS
ncbi:SDR family NAD(P)-dependent oxidoreductase [Nocardia brasiliensis]|uniref:SDR family NAD(P)-dependent oxidoreductase n=1 Tax=Nocardia brasiliensis TaxID=37326 RepID=UPI00366B1549